MFGDPTFLFGRIPFTAEEKTAEGEIVSKQASELRRLDIDVLLITVVLWAANWGILVTRAQAIAIQSGLMPALVRLVASLLGAATSVLIYQLLRRRELAALKRFFLALALSAPLCVLLAFANELLWLFGTKYYALKYGMTPAILMGGQCATHAEACHNFFVETIFTAGSFIWVYVAWCALYVGATMATDLRERERRLAVAEGAAHQAQLNSLRLQLNPHFLFNTLNTLSGLVALDRKQEAEQILLNLSQFLRCSLKDEAGQIVRLSKELEVESMYLDIEKVRFRDRLRVSYEIEKGCERALVPSFLLQPLVENALKHAVAPSERHVTITVAAEQRDGQLILKVENSASDQPSEREGDGLGIGLGNVRERLCALYGHASSFESGRTADGGWLNVIRLPFADQR